MAGSSEKKSVLFICLGNCCRSQIAEAVFRDLVTKEGVVDKWHIDSSAMAAYHIGQKGPDSRAAKCLKKRGLDNDSHIVRLTKKSDFTEFDYIFGMDDENMSDIDDVKPTKFTAQVKKLGDYHPDGSTIIIDPYYCDDEVFETVYEQCVQCCSRFLKAVS